jgi:hypothetical protein
MSGHLKKMWKTFLKIFLSEGGFLEKISKKLADEKNPSANSVLNPS